MKKGSFLGCTLVYKLLGHLDNTQVPKDGVIGQKTIFSKVRKVKKESKTFVKPIVLGITGNHIISCWHKI